MKRLRFFLFVMVICLASGVKAQFYDGPDDIYYYVETYHEKYEYVMTSFTTGHYTDRKIKERPEGDKAKVEIFNFDGPKAASLTSSVVFTDVSDVKSTLKNNPSYYEEKIETTEYDIKYVSSSSSGTKYERGYITYTFSNDRSTMRRVRNFGEKDSRDEIWDYKRVDKSYFRIGRSRTPSGTLYE